MDSSFIAGAVVDLLAPYLAKLAGMVVEDAGQALWEKTKAIYETLKARLSGDDYARETLERLEAEPQAAGRQKAMTAVLEEKVAADPELAKMLQELVAGAEEAGGGAIIQNVTVRDQARTGDINTIGSVKGSLDLSKKK